jgi:UDP-2,3-diacylglucosamine hydrolase
MSILLISDLHLSAEQPGLTRLFLYFLQHQAKHAEALYILGDLFEAWIGDDDETPFNKHITMALAELTASGITTYFMPGNRDFLIGPRFIEKTGCQLLADPSVIKLYGKPTLLMHGDSLCTLDKQYVIFRRLARTQLLQSLFLKLPLLLRQKIARYLRNSRHKNTRCCEAKFDVVMSELGNCLKHHSAQLIIHGHTHKPCIQLFQEKNKLYKRFVLSDWTNQQGNVLELLPHQQYKLIYFS